MSHSRGFTVVEVLIAVAIFGVAVVAIANYYPAAFRSVQIGRTTTAASFLVAEKLDELKNKDFAYTPSTDPESITLNSVTYTRTVSVTGPPAEGSARLKRYDVTVTWTVSGLSKSITAMTLVFDN